MENPGRIKVLQLCHKMPFPVHDGGSFSLCSTALGLLRQNIDLKVFSVNTPKEWVDPDKIPHDFRARTRFEFAMVDTRFHFWRALANLFSHDSYFVERFYSEDFCLELIKLLEKEEFDIIHLEHLYLCLYLDIFREHSKATIVLRPQNVENRLWQRVTNEKKNFLIKFWFRLATKRLAKFEKDKAKEVDGIISISAIDEEVFRSYSPQTPVITIPIGIDFQSPAPPAARQNTCAKPVFYHLGSMDWLPNVQGLRWFISEALPQILISDPGFELRIAGKKMPRWFYLIRSKNLKVDGEVEDARKYLLDKTVLIVPLFSGGGIRAKIIEAMSLGKTVISTTIGAEGIPYTDEKNILIANTSEEFALRIHECIVSPYRCHEIGANAFELAASEFDVTKTAAAMTGFYKKLRSGV